MTIETVLLTVDSRDGAIILQGTAQDILDLKALLNDAGGDPAKISVVKPHDTVADTVTGWPPHPAEAVDESGVSAGFATCPAARELRVGDRVRFKAEHAGYRDRHHFPSVFVISEISPIGIAYADDRSANAHLSRLELDPEVPAVYVVRDALDGTYLVFHEGGRRHRAYDYVGREEASAFLSREGALEAAKRALRETAPGHLLSSPDRWNIVTTAEADALDKKAAAA